MQTSGIGQSTVLGRASVFAALTIGAFVLSGISAHATDLTWTKLSNGGYNWDTTTLNWTNSSGVATNFTNGGVDNVLFPNQAAGNSIFVNVFPNMNPLSVTIKSFGTYVLTNGPIIGTGSVTIDGCDGCWLKIQNANTYSGGTIFNGGVLFIQNNNSLGTGPLTISGATHKQIETGLGVGNPITFTNAVILSNSAVTFDLNTQGRVTSSGPWTLIGSGTISNGIGATRTTISGPIGGSGSLTLLGADNSQTYANAFLNISGLNTYTGATTLTSTPTQTRILITGTNMNTSGTTIYGAEVQVGSPLVFGTNAVTIAVGGGGTPGTIGVNGSPSPNITLSNTFNVNAPAWVIQAPGIGQLTYAGPIILGTNAALLAGQAAATISGNISGNFGVNIGSHPTVGTANFVTLSGSNTYTGATILGGGIPSGGFYDAGRLSVSGGNAIPDSSRVILTNIAATALDIFTSERIGSLEGGGTAGGEVSIVSSTLFTGGNNSNTTYAGVIDAFGTGGQLVKEGTGTFTLTGNNNVYNNGTIVSNGTLRVNNSSGSGTGSGTVRVAPGATLGGTGTISGAVTVQTGGKLAPGNSPGILNVGNLTLQSNAIFQVEINGPTVGTQYDQANVTGTVNLTNAILSLVMGTNSTPGQQFIIVNNDSNDAIGGTFAGLPQGSFIDASGGGFSAFFNISYTGGTLNNDVVLTATIPEPATLTWLAVGALLLLRRRAR